MEEINKIFLNITSECKNLEELVNKWKGDEIQKKLNSIVNKKYVCSICGAKCKDEKYAKSLKHIKTEKHHKNLKKPLLDHLENPKDVCKNDLISLATEEINRLYSIQKSSNVFNNSFFESIDYLKLDYSGKVGEKIITKICDKFNIKYFYEEDKNYSDGQYDIKINNNRIEVKTARLGKTGTFQHESLKNCNIYDKLMFVSILPNKYYLTIIPKFDLNKKFEILGVTPHLRKGTQDVFKFDFKLQKLKILVDKGFSIEINDATNIYDVFDFIRDRT
jgi:hypothetical protein